MAETTAFDELVRAFSSSFDLDCQNRVMVPISSALMNAVI